MKKRHFVILIMILWSVMLLFSLGVATPVSALWDGGFGMTGELSFEHKDRDVASETTGIDLFYQGPFYLHCDEEEHGIYDYKDKPTSSSSESELSFFETATLPTVDELIYPDQTPVPQPDAETTTVVKTFEGSNRLSFEIDLDVEGESYYNKTTTNPLRREDDLAQGFTPPDADCVEEGTCEYYNNWEMTSADSFAYGGYGGYGDNQDIFFVSLDDNDEISNEQFWITGSLSYDYDLFGNWTYHSVTNTHKIDDDDDDVTYNERTGHFYTSFQTSFNIEGIDDAHVDFMTEMFRNEIEDPFEEITVGGEQFKKVTQKSSGDDSFTFSFLATEGIDYEFSFLASLYGYSDGIATYDSYGRAKLDLMVEGYNPLHTTPEPTTSLLLGIGIIGLYWYRKRFHKK